MTPERKEKSDNSLTGVLVGSLAGQATGVLAGPAAGSTVGPLARSAARSAAEPMDSVDSATTLGLRKKDRRVAYTKMALRNALIELMQGQHISGITVKSICRRADVNRSTFYLHYRDQYDLLHQTEREVLEALGARLGTQRDTAGTGPMSLTALTEILEYAQENSDIASVLLSENCDFAFRQDIMELAQIVVAWIDPSFSENTQDYVVAFVINGCIAFAEKWLESGMVEPPREIARLMLQLLSNGTASFTTQNATN